MKILATLDIVGGPVAPGFSILQEIYEKVG
jgi:hypothetical protein